MFKYNSDLKCHYQFIHGTQQAEDDKCSKIHIEKKCDKCMILGTSGVIWGDLETFWSDFRMQNQTVYLKVFVKFVNV